MMRTDIRVRIDLRHSQRGRISRHTRDANQPYSTAPKRRGTSLWRSRRGSERHKEAGLTARLR